MPWQMKTDCDGEKTAQIPGESTLKTFNLLNYADNFGLCRLPAAAERARGRPLAGRAGCAGRNAQSNHDDQNESE